jgi:DNA repair exonuclease SbcCD ATPase subunit
MRLFSRRKEKELQEKLAEANRALEREQESRRLEEYERKRKEREAARKLREIEAHRRELKAQEEREERLRQDRERQEEEVKQARMKMASPGSLRELRELIRTRYALDVEIWGLRMVRRPDRPIVEEMMEKSDAALLEIKKIVQAWDGTEGNWTLSEWEQVQEIRKRILASGKREWASNPPWGEE